MLTKEEIQKHPVLAIVNDITIFPKINLRKASKAIRAYGDKYLRPDDLLMLVDNTIFRTAKQGMFLTNEKLFAFSSFSGKFSIPLSEIRTLKPEIKTALKIELYGFSLNENYFVSLPGLGKKVVYDGFTTNGLEILVHSFKLLFDFEFL
jgi:hypothetical protein